MISCLCTVLETGFPGEVSPPAPALLQEVHEPQRPHPCASFVSLMHFLPCLIILNQEIPSWRTPEKAGVLVLARTELIFLLSS